MRTRAVALAVVLIFSSAFGSPARALVTTGDADGVGVSIGITGPVPVNTGLVPAVSVNSPPPNSVNQSLVNLAPLDLISAGLATVNASSNVDGLAGSRSAAGDSTLANLNLSLGVVLVNVVSVNSLQIFSSASVIGDYGALNPTGTSTFTNTSITVNTTTFTLNPNYAPNTTVFDNGLVKIIANEQILGGDGISLRDLTVNALHISLLNILGISGDIFLGQSHGALTATAVPEPSTALLLAIGLVAFAGGRRR